MEFLKNVKNTFQNSDFLNISVSNACVFKNGIFICGFGKVETLKMTNRTLYDSALECF